jgi:hypothetical protein
VREVRGLREDVLGGYLYELGEGAVVGEPEDAVLLAGLPRVVAPVERGVDDHLRPLVWSACAIAAGDYLARAVRAKDDGKGLGLRPRVLAPGHEHVAAVEGRGVQPDERLTRAGFRVRGVLVAQLLGAVDLVQYHGFHVAPFGPSGIRLQASGFRYQLITDASSALFASYLIRRAARYRIRRNVPITPT